AGRLIVDLCDVDSAKFEDYAASGERLWLNAREARLLAKEEARLAVKSDATLLISDAEAALFLSRLPEPSLPNVQVISNGIDADAFNPDQVAPHPKLASSEGPHFVFTGQMDYRPNEAAAIWAIENFVPRVRERFPEATLHIVGRNPTAELEKNARVPGVRIWGEVPDVRPFLTSADCVLAPLLIARGVQNKVLEAMAMARPVLLTPEAATGIAAKDGEHWLVAPANAGVMRERFEHLVSDPRKAEHMGQAARRFVLDHHAWGATLDPFEVLVRGAAEQGEARNAA
ncbi:MAG: glycosyltransferase, partial [Pseudomonadota bacterium]